MLTGQVVKQVFSLNADAPSFHQRQVLSITMGLAWLEDHFITALF